MIFLKKWNRLESQRRTGTTGETYILYYNDLSKKKLTVYFGSYKLLKKKNTFLLKGSDTFKISKNQFFFYYIFHLKNTNCRICPNLR